MSRQISLTESHCGNVETFLKSIWIMEKVEMFNCVENEILDYFNQLEYTEYSKTEKQILFIAREYENILSTEFISYITHLALLDVKGYSLIATNILLQIEKKRYLAKYFSSNRFTITKSLASLVSATADLLNGRELARIIEPVVQRAVDFNDTCALDAIANANPVELAKITNDGLGSINTRSENLSISIIRLLDQRHKVFFSIVQRFFFRKIFVEKNLKKWQEKHSSWKTVDRIIECIYKFCEIHSVWSELEIKVICENNGIKTVSSLVTIFKRILLNPTYTTEVKKKALQALISIARKYSDYPKICKEIVSFLSNRCPVLIAIEESESLFRLTIDLSVYRNELQEELNGIRLSRNLSLHVIYASEQEVFNNLTYVIGSLVELIFWLFKNTNVTDIQRLLEFYEGIPDNSSCVELRIRVLEEITRQRIPEENEVGIEFLQGSDYLSTIGLMAPYIVQALSHSCSLIRASSAGLFVNIKPEALNYLPDSMVDSFLNLIIDPEVRVNQEVIQLVRVKNFPNRFSRKLIAYLFVGLSRLIRTQESYVIVVQYIARLASSLDQENLNGNCGKLVVHFISLLPVDYAVKAIELLPEKSFSFEHFQNLIVEIINKSRDRKDLKNKILGILSYETKQIIYGHRELNSELVLRTKFVDIDQLTAKVVDLTEARDYKQAKALCTSALATISNRAMNQRERTHVKTLEIICTIASKFPKSTKDLQGFNWRKYFSYADYCWQSGDSGLFLKQSFFHRLEGLKAIEQRDSEAADIVATHLKNIAKNLPNDRQARDIGSLSDVYSCLAMIWRSFKYSGKAERSVSTQFKSLKSILNDSETHSRFFRSVFQKFIEIGDKGTLGLVEEIVKKIDIPVLMNSRIPETLDCQEGSEQPIVSHGVRINRILINGGCSDKIESLETEVYHDVTLEVCVPFWRRGAKNLKIESISTLKKDFYILDDFVIMKHDWKKFPINMSIQGRILLKYPVVVTGNIIEFKFHGRYDSAEATPFNLEGANSLKFRTHDSGKLKFVKEEGQDFQIDDLALQILENDESLSGQ